MPYHHAEGAFIEMLHQPKEIVARRYRIIQILGQGGSGTTYEAENVETGKRVALKALSLRRMKDWKMIALLERKAQILCQIDYPGIPPYLDYFHINTARNRSFYIAQELAEGKSLGVLVENGWHPDEKEVQFLAIQLLEILVYLQDLNPAIVHRDINPKNIIRREDGHVFLVDFATVADTYYTINGGSAIVGTYGYIAPEQCQGQAGLATDVYGLGATLLFLLYRKSPAELPQSRLKMNFRSHFRGSKKIAAWLENAIAPTLEDRFATAKAALAALLDERSLICSLAEKPSRPKNTNISLMKVENRLVVVDIPPVWLGSDRSLIFPFIALFWNALFVAVVWKILPHLNFLSPLASFFLFFFGFSGLWMLITFLISLIGRGSRIRLEIDRRNFRLERWFLGGCYQKIEKPTEEIYHINISRLKGTIRNKAIVIYTHFGDRSKLRKERFGLFLTLPEKEWVVREIFYFIKNIRL